MELVISNASMKPIYEQITDQIKNLIISGDLKEGDSLPSLRSLARDLHISVITTKRAYDDLERDGFIATMAGKGCFVAVKNPSLIREEQMKRMEQALQQAVDIALFSAISLDEMIEALRILYKGE